MLWSCRFGWHPNTTARQVRRRVVELALVVRVLLAESVGENRGPAAHGSSATDASRG
jgi:hypothetical protein